MPAVCRITPGNRKRANAVWIAKRQHTDPVDQGDHRVRALDPFHGHFNAFKDVAKGVFVAKYFYAVGYFICQNVEKNF